MPSCFVVIGGYAYEGYSLGTLRLFSDRSAADAYSAQLKSENICDYVVVTEKDIDA